MRLKELPHMVVRLALAGLASGLATTALAQTPPVDINAYAGVLTRFVTDGGRVDYAALKNDHSSLDEYLASLAAASESHLQGLSRDDRIAFWINAYNALTLKTIVDHYPVRPHGLFSWRFPDASIRQIPGAWTDAAWTVAGEKLSLDQIENDKLRKAFHEPRVHMALVCAALGCPPLRREPYRGDRLDEQLDDQARRYLAGPAGLRADSQHRAVAVSSIFKWFADDLAASGGVRAFLERYAPSEVRPMLTDPDVAIRFLDYDWTLNDVKEH